MKITFTKMDSTDYFAIFWGCLPLFLLFVILGMSISGSNTEREPEHNQSGLEITTKENIETLREDFLNHTHRYSDGKIMGAIK